MPTHDIQIQLQEALREARRAKNLTQVDVAKRLNKPQSFVSKYESGERRLDVSEFIAVCQALGISSQALLQALESDQTEDSQ